MTPEEARRLLDGTTPGPWVRRRDADGNPTPVVVSAGPTDRHHIMTAEPAASPERQQADTALIAAAPALAAMRAGMREEWGVTCEEVAGPTTFTYGEWADSAGKRLTHHTARLLAWEKVRAGYPNVRVVRRYVTEPEEA